jgi:thioesterase domain-containing protein/acyl carrier protein
VKDCVVIVRDDTPGGNAVVAYVMAEGAAPSPGAIRERLRETLPEYMVPSFFVFVEEFALTPNGKIDRRALPPPGRPVSSATASVAPRDPIEDRLAGIWCEVLRLPSVGVNENFFELGGESLLAVRMFVRVEEAFGRQLPLATLFEAPTIEGLAERLRGEGWKAPWSPLIAIQPQGELPPFFCVHGVGGNVLNYRSLSTHLGAQQPFYGLQSRGLDGREPPILRIEEMAELYLAEIRRVRPNGPYLLGGASFGGVVAYEMARQLERAGAETALVALFDTNPVNYEAADRDAAAPGGLVARMRVHFDVLRRGPDRWSYFRKKARRVRRKLIYGAWQKTAGVFEKLRRPLPRSLQNVQQANYKALSDYRPGTYGGRVVLFCAAGEPEEFNREKRRGWRLLAPHLEVLTVPGDHLTMIEEPHVRELAERLREVMRIAD